MSVENLKDTTLSEITQLRAKLETLTAERNRLRLGVRLAVGQLDRALGDTDPPDPDHPLLKACQILSRTLESHPEDGP